MARAKAQPDKKPEDEGEVLVNEKENKSHSFLVLVITNLKMYTEEVCDSVFLPLKFRP